MQDGFLRVFTATVLPHEGQHTDKPTHSRGCVTLEIVAADQNAARFKLHADETVKAVRGVKAKMIRTEWEHWTYDVWGNRTDGYEVNDRYKQPKLEVDLDVYEANTDTPRAFQTVDFPHKDIKLAMGIRRGVQIEVEGDDITYYVYRASDRYPLGEITCISHESLSPIVEKATAPKTITNA